MELKRSLLSLCAVSFLSFCSCELLSTPKMSSADIKKASSWSSKDQPPTYPECEALETKEQLECFQNIISDQLTQAILAVYLVANKPLEEEILVQLKIDKSGVFSLLESKIPNSVQNALPELDQVLAQVVSELPKALPATKTNVGVYVNVQLSLPVYISAQPFE